MSRPEHIAPPEVFYNPLEAQKYTSNSRVQSIQAEMTYRCLELLDLPTEEHFDEEGEPSSVPKQAYLLDIGAGSGLSGEILTEEGHHWVGMDVSGGMLEVALEREVEGDLFLADIGQGIPFRPASFDGAISVSVLQWLCNADATSHSPSQRLLRFFTDLFGCLKKGARAVFQFYPESDEQASFIMGYATKAGFGGGLCVDYVSASKPNSSKKKKFYLILFAGQPISGPKPAMPEPLTDETPSRVGFEQQRQRLKIKSRGKGKKGGVVKNLDWILRKKELYRKRGKADVPRDSKYTARKRKVRF
ncbi:BQ5605_C004g03050 [Microbotryum silenes-dioicae]|uniref:BQ5605_C004g03050 protein n=1 Tax=Microbotryum silenes-dioicae TaxID=796604 RepID=A0A2X0M9N6_9BASI|nr:BQ5605_C004g03050 [Microbotryum silenes-dioicae]